MSSPPDSRPGNRLAVLASGRGSNLQALCDAIAAGTLAADLVGVFSDRPRAAALQRVPRALRWSADARAFASRDRFDAALADAIAAARPDWIVCAGYLRILGADFVARFHGRLLNIHPSLLPAFKGLRTHQQALDAGARRHGASVHFVTADLDGGPLIAQARVPVLPGDDADALAARVLEQEHLLLAETLRWLLAGRITLAEDRVHVDGQPRAPLQLTAKQGFA